MMGRFDLPEDASARQRVDALLGCLARGAASDYIGEPISQLDHALQCAALAEKTGDDELVLAALLHDIGHLADPSAAAMDGPTMENLGAHEHERLGHDLLLRLGLSERVARLVLGHVDAKRYLAARRPDYLANLSDASRHTLELQGGPMEAREAEAFEAEACFDAMIRLRRLDEAAKEPARATPELEHYRPLLETHLQRQELADLEACFEPLADDQLARWKRDHVLVMNGMLSARGLARLRQWTDDLAARPETPGKWMKYFERTADSERQLCRVEDFVPHHAGFGALLTQGPLLGWLGQLMGEEAVLFKEKINFKLPGGAGFRAHQDAPAFTSFGQRYHITLLMTVDRSSRVNGGLELSDPVEVYELLAQQPDGTLSRELESELPWRPLDLEAGSVVLFDSYIPHRSPANLSQLPRRSLYVTYNRLSEGDRRADYYADKRRCFPPEIEREPGIDYAARAGRYNLGNPIR